MGSLRGGSQGTDAARAAGQPSSRQPPNAAALAAEDRFLGQPRARSLAGGHLPPPVSRRPRRGRPGLGGQRCVTPRQTCPQPDGFGRNLRSKTRWFTGFCNSHQVSHFATFFIDARAEISVAESRLDLSKIAQLHRKAPSPGPLEHALSLRFPWRDLRRGSLGAPGARGCAAAPGAREGAGQKSPPPPRALVNGFAGRSARQVSTMILPQVHLRKPCYDFSFL